MMPARGRGGELPCHCNRVVRSWCRYGRVMQSRRSSDRVVASRWLSHGEFKFAVAAVGIRSPLKRGAPALSCSAKASHGARGDRALRRHPHRACSRIDATALRVRGQKRCGARSRSRLREECHGCIRSVMRVRANDLDVTAALVRTVRCVGRVLKLISRRRSWHQQRRFSFRGKEASMRQSTSASRPVAVKLSFLIAMLVRCDAS